LAGTLRPRRQPRGCCNGACGGACSDGKRVPSTPSERMWGTRAPSFVAVADPDSGGSTIHGGGDE
jgi:hypothetical protein